MPVLHHKAGGVMKITVDIPDRVWWNLSELAEKRGVKVGELVRITIRETPQDTQDDLIKTLVTSGFPDADVAARLGILVYQVATRRRWMGLKPNKRPRDWGATKRDTGHTNKGEK